MFRSDRRRASPSSSLAIGVGATLSERWDPQSIGITAVPGHRCKACDEGMARGCEGFESDRTSAVVVYKFGSIVIYRIIPWVFWVVVGIVFV